VIDLIKSEKKIFAIEIILSMFFFSNVFLKNIVNDYFIIIVLLIATAFIYLMVGYEKDSNINGKERRKLLQYVSFYCIGFIILEYGLGLLTGYIKTPYKNDIFILLKNIFPIILIIFLSEHLRYMIVKKGEKNKIILLFVTLLFILIDLSLNVQYYDLSRKIDLLEFSTVVFLPSFFKNIMLTVFTYRYGMKPSVLYRLIMELYIYIIPITPDLGMYLDSVLLMVFPLLLNRIINYGFEKSKKKAHNSKNQLRITVGIIIFIFIASIVALNSNLFRFWMAAVGSGSMEPTIDVGDLIIVDKGYQKNLDKLSVGDVLVFKIGQNIYTHRITKINKENSKYSINTKGDRKGQIEDSWIVTNQDVIGVVKYKIKYIGYPTVWLSRILEGNNG